MKKITIEVNGMACGMCEAHVCDVIRKNFNVKKVTASHVKKQAVIIAEAVDEQKLREVIATEGYTTGDCKTEEYLKKEFFSLF